MVKQRLGPSFIVLWPGGHGNKLAECGVFFSFCKLNSCNIVSASPCFSWTPAVFCTNQMGSVDIHTQITSMHSFGVGEYNTNCGNSGRRCYAHWMREKHSGTSSLRSVSRHVFFLINCLACPVISSGYAPSHCQNASEPSPSKLVSAVVSELTGVFEVCEVFLQLSSTPTSSDCNWDGNCHV